MEGLAGSRGSSQPPLVQGQRCGQQIGSLRLSLQDPGLEGPVLPRRPPSFSPFSFP